MSDPNGTKDRRKPAPSEDESARAILPDFVRRAFALGLSGLFTTEEAFRRALGDTVPKDWVDFAVDQSDRTRSEMTGRMAEEIGRVLDNVDLEDLLRTLLAEHRVEIRAELTLVPREPESSSETGDRKQRKTTGSGSVKVVGSRSRK